MFARVKNALFNIKLFLKYFRNKKITISKQVRNYELSDIDLSKNSTVVIKEGLSLRKNVSIRCRNNAYLFIGKNASFNNNCVLTCRGKITVGDNVCFGPNVAIFDHDHDYRAKDRRYSFTIGEIKIGDNSWIGASAVILKGATIGKNCVIAAGAIVNCHVPDNTIYISKEKIKKIEYKNE